MYVRNSVIRVWSSLPSIRSTILNGSISLSFIVSLYYTQLWSHHDITCQQILSRSHGWNHLRLDGSVLAEKRQSLVQHFNRYSINNKNYAYFISWITQILISAVLFSLCNFVCVSYQWAKSILFNAAVL